MIHLDLKQPDQKFAKDLIDAIYVDDGVIKDYFKTDLAKITEKADDLIFGIYEDIQETIHSYKTRERAYESYKFDRLSDFIATSFCSDLKEYIIGYLTSRHFFDQNNQLEFFMIKFMFFGVFQELVRGENYHELKSITGFELDEQLRSLAINNMNNVAQSQIQFFNSRFDTPKNATQSKEQVKFEVSVIHNIVETHYPPYHSEATKNGNHLIAALITRNIGIREMKGKLRLIDETSWESVVKSTGNYDGKQMYDQYLRSRIRKLLENK